MLVGVALDISADPPSMERAKSAFSRSPLPLFAANTFSLKPMVKILFSRLSVFHVIAGAAASDEVISNVLINPSLPSPEYMRATVFLSTRTKLL